MPLSILNINGLLANEISFFAFNVGPVGCLQLVTGIDQQGSTSEVCDFLPEQFDERSKTFYYPAVLPRNPGNISQIQYYYSCKLNIYLFCSADGEQGVFRVRYGFQKIFFLRSIEYACCL